MFGAVLILLGLLMVQQTHGVLDYTTKAAGMQLEGDFSIAGLFPLHYAKGQSLGLPAVGECNE